MSADGFISPLDFRSTASFESGPPAVWSFVANAGDGRTVQIQMSAVMLEGRNTTVFRFSRPSADRQAAGKQLPAEADVRLTVRLDIEDRNFHWETKRNGGADYHFSTHVRALDSLNRQAVRPRGPATRWDSLSNPQTIGNCASLRTRANTIPTPEWSENIPHPVEQSRGQTGSGDAYSPGWFELPLKKGTTVTLTVTADPPTLAGGG